MRIGRTMRITAGARPEVRRRTAAGAARTMAARAIVRRRRRASVTFALAVLTVTPAPGSAAEFDASTGYRTDRYRTPVDRPLEGGETADIATVDRLLAEKGAALVDVMPARAGYDARTGRWRLADRHVNIAGSVWLPEVGRGALDPVIEAYFRNALRQLTAEAPGRPLIFYCMADCWMSWNVVKRAASYGYRNLYWYPEGTDGWRDADRPLVDGDPWPIPLSAGSPTASRIDNGRPQ